MHRRWATIATGIAVAVSSPYATADEPAKADQPERVLPPGHFLGDDGAMRPFKATHDDGVRPFRREPHYVRAALEDLLIVAIGTSYYWIQPHENMRDWDFPGGKKPISGFVPSFDTNKHVTNDVLHPMFAGGFYYWVARANGLTIPWAIAYSTTTSAMFEFFFEWLERASINDLTMTPGGGWSTGEVYLHIADYLLSSPKGGLGRDVLAWTLGFPSRVNKQKSNGPQNPLPADNLGYSSYYWHRFQLMLGSVVASNDFGESTSLTEIYANTRIYAIPGFLKPGEFSLNYSDGEFTEAQLRFDIRNGLNQTYDIEFNALLAGYYEQNIDLGKRGYAWTAGLETSYQFAERIKLDRYDAHALLHLLGLGTKFWTVDRDVTARFEFSTSPDFAVIQNQAWPYWRAQFGDEGTKTQLKQEGYDFSYGWSARARAVLEVGGFELGAKALAGTYGSFDRWYRFMGDITRNIHQSDQILETEAWLGFTAPETPVHIQFYGLHAGHTTNMDPITARTWDNVIGGLVGAQF